MATWPAKINYATGDVLTAAQMNDIGGELNDVYTASGAAAGKNKIINGDFGIWQRGTSFSNPTDGQYIADRWAHYGNGSGATKTLSQQTFTPGTAPVAGYEGQYFFRFAQSVAGTTATYNGFRQRVEDVRTFAGQTITVSFWAKADATRTLTTGLIQGFGSGGSGDVSTAGTANTLTTSWVRYSNTISVPSVSGKTIGTSSYLAVNFDLANNTAQTVDIWGVQLEAGSTATPFQTATGTKQGELAACQRYYYRASASLAYSQLSQSGFADGTTTVVAPIAVPVVMRVAPTSVEYSSVRWGNGTGGAAITALAISGNQNGAQVPVVAATVSGVTSNNSYRLLADNSSSAYIGLSAEL